MGAPGTYTVRLTVDGKSYTQPITVKMDPRVKETLGVQQIYTLTTQAENAAMTADAALKEAHAAAEKLRAKTQSAANDALIKEIEAIAPSTANAPGPVRAAAEASAEDAEVVALPPALLPAPRPNRPCRRSRRSVRRSSGP